MPPKPARKVIDTKKDVTKTSTTEPDGTIVEVIVTKTTEKFSDGKTGVSTTTQTIRKAPPPKKSVTGHATVLNVNLTPANSKAPKVPNTTNKAFIQACLESHNTLRALHGAPPLKLNEDLAKIAQAWANTLAAKIGKMQHNSTGFGENIYWKTEDPPAARPPEMWYSEINDFDFNKKPLEGKKGTGHFTQLIWKSSKLVGIAMAVGNNGYFVVANYFPQGNIIGKYPDNICKPL